MYPLMLIFDAKKAIYGKNLHQLYLDHFLTNLAQIFTSLLTFHTDQIAALKFDIFSPFHAYFSVLHLHLKNWISAIFQPIWLKFSPAS